MPSFIRFPELPKELRDAIWRLCLPNRVVELDIPDADWYFDVKYQYGVDRGERLLRPDGSEYECGMRHTTTINLLPPVISRVCHEARSIALESAKLHLFSPEAQAGPSDFVSAAWIDSTRDTLCLHYLPHGGILNTHWDPVLRRFLSIKNSTGIESLSICNDLLEAHEGYSTHVSDDIPQILRKGCSSYLIFTNVVVIHADEKDAIDAGIFGALGEERVVLVDVFDTQRLYQYKTFALAHRSKQDSMAEAFFEPPSSHLLSGWPLIRYAETPQEYSRDLEIHWLLYSQNRYYASEHGYDDPLRSNWLKTPESFDGVLDDPRYKDYEDLPGRPFARQMWEPNRDHPWVQEALSRMPQFHPVIMFRLCTRDCWSSPSGSKQATQALDQERIS